MVQVNLPFAPEPKQEEEKEEVVEVQLFADLSLEGVTSGADSTAWDPVRIEKEEKQLENDDVLDTDLKGTGPAGVTSGNDGTIDDVKSSKRKYRDR
jgi:hypothetical protein